MSHAVLRLFVFLFALDAVAQTANDFSARYGYPNAERFIVRPGITMMASYAEDRSACEMFIEPKLSTQQRDDKEHSLAAGTVSEIIDELVPERERGILLRSNDRICWRCGGKGCGISKCDNQQGVRRLPAEGP